MEANNNMDSEEQQIPVNDVEQEDLNSENLDLGGDDDLWKVAQEAAQEIEGSGNKANKREDNAKTSHTDSNSSGSSSDFNNAKVALLKNELEAKDNQLKRMAADFDNFRRRQALEKEELIKTGCKEFIIDLLPVLDNFERAIASSKDAKEISSVISGIEMIQKQLLESISKNGVQTIECLNEAFDPNFHEAVQKIVDDSKPDETIINELQKGYTLNGKVLRPSTVVVSAVSS